MNLNHGFHVMTLTAISAAFTTAADSSSVLFLICKEMNNGEKKMMIVCIWMKRKCLKCSSCSLCNHMSGYQLIRLQNMSGYY